MSEALDGQLHRAAAAGDLAAVEAALAAGANVNARAEYGDSALNEAAEWGHLEVARRLAETGADIENLGGADKTPLMNAAFAGHTELVLFLLERGAHISDDLLMSLSAKVNIFRGQAEDGFVNPTAVEAWQKFLDYMSARRREQDGKRAGE